MTATDKTVLLLNEIAESLKALKEASRIVTKEILNVPEAAKFLGLSDCQIYRLVKERSIPHYKKGKYLLFERNELRNWLLSDRIPTREEVDARASTYVALNPLR